MVHLKVTYGKSADEQGSVIGIEVLAAESKLPAYLLQRAERLDD